MAQTVITIDHAGKKFCKSLKKSMLYGAVDILQSITTHIPDAAVLREDEFWAVDDVSLKLQAGETLGIVGQNGSGKTTLLKMLNGIFMPDKGRIEITGRVGALIQVGAGFHPMLSGRENVYINGAILGMTKKEIDQKFDSIAAFADIGDFLDAPMKHYSSGMFVRLGFAVAIHGHPRILLIDEILAVGDKDFQIKCYQKMNEIKKDGTTIILVSHNEYTIREQTERCLYLNKGKQVALGSSEEVISRYLKDVYEHKSQTVKALVTRDTRQEKKARLLTVKFLNKQREEVSYIESGDELNITVECDFKERPQSPIVGINFYDDHGLMYCANSDYEQADIRRVSLGKQKINIKIPECHLPTNHYLCSAIIADESVTNLVDWHDMAYRLVVGRARNARGLVKLKTQWTVDACG